MRKGLAAFLLALAASAALPVAAAAQSVGLAGRAGMFGLGGEGNIDFGRHFGLRGGLGAVPLNVIGTFSDVDFQIQPPSPLGNVGADIYPFGGHFRLSGGLLFSHDISMTAKVTGTVKINGNSYTGAQAGTISGKLAWSSTAPYATLGFSGRGKGFGLSFDIGTAFLGAPTLTLTSNGPANQGNAQFRADLAAEQKKDQEDAGKYLKLLPLLSFGVRWGI
jgi:hypothetical protein